MAFGSFSAANEAVDQFVTDNLLASALSISAPESVNILDSFTHFLTGHGFNLLRASEEAQKQENLVLRHIERELREWRFLGVPSPIDYVDDNNRIMITWKHHLFPQKKRGHPPFDTANFVAIYDWLSSLHDRDFSFCLCITFETS